MSNRVEELETTVAELESTVRGLTEELVETKERLRALETETGVDAAGLVDGTVTADTEEPNEESEVEEANTDADEELDEQHASEEPGDDIIIA